MPVSEQDAIRAMEAFKGLGDQPELQAKAKAIHDAYRSEQEAAGKPLFPEFHRAQAEDFGRVRKMFTDRERHGFDGDQFAEVSQTLTDPEKKARFLNEQFLSRQFQLPTSEIRNLGTQYRDQYAKAAWGLPVATDAEFYQKIGEDFDTEDAVADVANRAAMQGLSSVASFSQIPEEVKNSDAFKRQEKRLTEVFEEQAAATAARLAPYRETVRQTVEDLQATMGVQAPGAEGEKAGFGDFANRLLEIPKADRDFVISAIIANAGEGEGKNVGKKLAENFARGGADIGYALSNSNLLYAGNRSRNELLSARRKLEQGLIPSTTYGFGEMIADRIILDPTDAEGEQLQQVDPADEKSGIKEALALIDKEIEFHHLHKKLRTIAENDIDPAKGENIVTRGLYSAVRSIPYTAVAMVPGGALVNMAALNEESYYRLKEANPGMSDSEANAIASIGAPIQSLLETVSAKILTGRMPTLGRFLNKAVATKSAAATRFGVRLAESEALEMVQENFQDVTPFAVQGAVAALSDDMPDVPWKEIYGDFWNQQGELFFAVLPLAIIGAGAGTVSDFKNGKALLSSPREIASIIGNEAKASEIADLAKEGNFEGAQSLLREELRNVGKDSAPIQETRQKALEAIQKDSTEKRQAIEKGEAIGMIPVVSPLADGKWVVRFNDKTDRTFDNFTEANEARWKHSGNESMRYHEDIVETITHADRTQREGQGTRYIFGQGKERLLDRVNRGEVSREAALNRADTAADVDQQAEEKTDEEIKAGIGQEYDDSYTAAQLKALSEDDRLAALTIIGENTTEFEHGLYITTAKLHGGATWATVIEEKLEGDVSVMLKKGRRDWLRQSLRAFERQSGEVIFRAGIKDDEITDGDIKEAYARAGLAYFIGTADEKDGFQRSAKFKKRYDGFVKAGLSGSMEGYARFFSAVAIRADSLQQMRKRGALDPELERELARSTGFGEQAQFEQSVEKEAAANLDELSGAGFVLSEDAPFSVIADYGIPHRPRDDGPRAFDLAEDDMMPSDVYDHPEWYSGMDTKVINETMAQLRKVRGKPDGTLTIFRAAPIGEMNNGDWVSLSKEYARTHAMGIDPDENPKVWGAKVKAKDVRWSMDDLSEFGYFGEQITAEDTGASFSVITNADSRIADMFNPILRNPEQRRRIVLEMQRKGAENGRKFQEIIRFNRTDKDIETERKTREGEMMGDKLDTLSPAEIGALEALGTLDDVGMRPILSDLLREKYYKTKSGKSVKYWRGSLMSKSAAEKAGINTKGGEWDGIPEGLPPYVWGGSIMPDQAAGQFGFDSVEEFWSALESEVASYQNLKADTKAALLRIRELEKEAKAESRELAAEQKKLRKTVGTDRATLIAAMRILQAMVSALPSEIRGKIGGFVQLAQFKTPGAMLDELERRVVAMDRELERWLKKEADKGVKKLFDLAKPAKDESGKKPVGKAGADIHDLFSVARQAWKNWDAAKAEAHAVGLESEVSKGDLSPEMEAHKLMEAELVRAFGGWNEADSVRKNHALDTAEEIWREAYHAYKLKKAAEKERRDGIRAALRLDTGKVGKKSERALAELAGTKLPGKSRDFFLSLLNFEQLTAWAFGKESTWARWFADEQRKAENAKLDAVQVVTDGIDAHFTQLAGGNRFAGEKLQYRMMQRTLTATAANGDIVPLSELEALSALLMWQQEDGKRHLRGKRDENGAIISDWAYDEDFIDEISGKLSKEAWATLAFLQSEYGQEYEPLNAVYRDLYGINLPKNPNYSPLTVKPTQAPGGQTQDPLTGSTASAGSFTPGSLRSRAQVSSEPDFRDAVATYLAHKKQIEHWKANAKFITEANAVLGNREVGNSIEAAHGQEAVKILRKWLDAIAQGGVRDAAAGTTLMRLLEKVTGNAASMALVGRAGTLAIQATQLGAAAAKMPTGAYVVRLGKLLSGNLGWGAALKSEYIQRRLAQQPVMVQAAMEGLRAGKPTQLKHQVRKIGQLINGADALFTAGTYAMVHDYQYSQAIKGGMTPAEADVYATQEAERIVDDVAQPSRMGARSYFEVSSSNPIARLAWAFASDARKNAALVGFNAANSSKPDAARAILFVVVINGFMGSVIRNAWRDARGDDDDEIFDERYWSSKRMALTTSTDWLFGFPIIGEEIQRALYSVAGEYTPDGGLLSAISQAPGAAKNIVEGDSTDFLRDVEKIMTAAGLFSDNTAAATSVMHILRDVYGIGKNFLPE